MNKFHTIGRIGNELVLEKTKAGKSALKINLAVRRNRDITDWFNLVSYNATAENIAKFFKKGDLIGIEGQLFNDTYEKDGKKLTFTKVLVSEFTFCSSSSENKEEHTWQQQAKESKKVESNSWDTGEPIDISSDDLPF